MPLSRQIWLLLAGMLALALVGSATLSTLTARDQLQAQLQASDSAAATALALAVGQQPDDIDRRRGIVRAYFDAGGIRRVRDVAADGRMIALHEAVEPPSRAPSWFVELVPVEAPGGRARVVGFDGTASAAAARPLGWVEVWSSTARLHDALWRGCLRLLAVHGALAIAAGAVAGLLARRLRRPFNAVIGQARSLVEGRFVTLPEPRAAELQRLTRAMNAMVGRLKSMFDAQAAQVEQLRRQAQCDSLTGVFNRGHFLGELRAALQREDGPSDGGVVMLRVCDLARLNRMLGHATVDRMLCAIAQLLMPYGERVRGCVIGRLNGADFALCVPVGGVAEEIAQALAGMLRNALPAFGAGISVALGTVELRRDMALADVMAAVDTALARSESRGTYAVERGLPPAVCTAGADASGVIGGMGETAWRERIADALEHDRLKLVSFPLIDAEHGLVHLECMLRLQLRENGPFEIAAHWLPHAARSRITATLDERAVALALRAISTDGEPRCINLSPLSLLDSGHVARLRALLFASPPAARKLWLEIAEVAVIEQFALVRELGRQLRPCGVRWGLEHVGPGLGRIDHLFEAGFDYVKLDASMTLGVAGDAQRTAFVHGSIDMLHSLSLRVYAEGVSDSADARALWGCGVDGITGPWASMLRADAVS